MQGLGQLPPYGHVGVRRALSDVVVWRRDNGLTAVLVQLSATTARRWRTSRAEQAQNMWWWGNGDDDGQVWICRRGVCDRLGFLQIDLADSGFAFEIVGSCQSLR
jgi:hypothetical protein